MQLSRPQFRIARSWDTGKCAVRSRGARALFQLVPSLFRIRSSLVAQWNLNTAWRMRRWLSCGLPVYLDNLGSRRRLTEFDRYCFAIGAHRAFIGSLFIVDAICWFDARQKQLQSATRTTSSGNWRQRGRIWTIWLWHSAVPMLQAGAQLISQPPTPAISRCR